METIGGRNCSSGEVTPWQAAKWLGALDVTDTVQSVPVRLGCVLEKSKASLDYRAVLESCTRGTRSTILILTPAREVYGT